MKTRTQFKLHSGGLVHCWCGSLGDFIMDINDFILPILEDHITAEFNGVKITIYSYDNKKSIYDKFTQAFDQ